MKKFSIHLATADNLNERITKTVVSRKGKKIVFLHNKQKNKRLQQPYVARVLTIMGLIELPKIECTCNNWKNILTILRK